MVIDKRAGRTPRREKGNTMQTKLSGRNAFQTKTIAKYIPEVEVTASTITFPYDAETALGNVEHATRSAKSKGDSNALHSIRRALADNKGVMILDDAEKAELAEPAPAKAKKPAKAVKTTADGKCLCGCGEKVTREFLPGHDARYKGQLIKAALNLPSTFTGSADDALVLLSDRNWTQFLEKSRNALAAKLDRKAKNPNSIKRGKAAIEGPTVKIGEMREAAAMLKKIGRYGEKAGDRQIELTPAAIPQVLDGTHPDLTDSERVELGFSA